MEAPKTWFRWSRPHAVRPAKPAIHLAQANCPSESPPRQEHRMKISWVALAALVVSLSALAVSAADPAAGLIVFSSNRSGPWRIYTVRPDGSDLRELSKAGGDEQDVDPVFSPDGKLDAVHVYPRRHRWASGRWPSTAQSRSGSATATRPSGRPTASGSRFGRRSRWSFAIWPSGSEKVISPKDLPHCSGPAWSPDGKTIAFACRWEAGNGLFTVSADGGEPVKVYDKKGACEPHFSPDGKRLVYETETNICTIDPDGKKNRRSRFSAACSATGGSALTGNRLFIARANRSRARGNCTLFRPKVARR